MSWRKLASRALGAVVLLATLAVATVFGTGAGLRWAYSAARPYLPAALIVEGLDGSLLWGIQASKVGWADDRVTIRASEVSAEVALMRLLDREVRIESPRIGSLSVSIAEGETAEEPILEPPTLRLPIDLGISDAIISDLSVKVGGTDRYIERLALTGRWDGTRLRLSELDVQSEWLLLALSGQAELKPPYAAMLEGDWTWRAPAGESWNGNLSLEGDWRAYSARHVLNAPAQIRTEGEITLEDFGGSVDLVHAWDNIDTAIDDRPVRLSEGRLRTAGDLDRYDAELQSAVEVDGYPRVVTGITALGNRDGLEIRESSFVSEPAEVVVRGRVNWAGQPSWALDVGVLRFDPAWVDDRATGTLSAGTWIEGRRREDGTLDADIRIDALDGQLNRTPVTGSGSVTLRANRMEALMANLGIGQNRLRVQGRIGPELELDVALDAPALEELVPGLGGSLAVDGHLEGPPANPALRAEVTSAGIRWNDYSAENVAVTLDGRMDGHSLSLSAESRGASIGLEAAGALIGERWDGTLRSMTVAGEPAGEWSLESPAMLGASDALISVVGYCIGRRDFDGNLCIDLDYDLAGNDVNARFDSRGVPVSALLAEVSDEVQARGTVAATGALNLSGARLDGSLRVVVEGGGLTAQYEGELIDSRLEQAELTAQIVDGQLDGQAAIVLGDGLGRLESRLSADDIRDPGTPIDATLTVAINDLTSLALFVPEISRPAGRLDGALNVRGTAVDPGFQGSLSLEGGRFDVPAAGITVDEVSIEVFQTRLDELAVRGSARSGQGELQLSGVTDFRSPTGIRTELQVTGDNVELLRIPDRQITASPDLRLVFDERMVDLTGLIRVPAASFVLNELPKTATSASPDVVVHREDQVSSTARRYAIDLRAELGEDVSIEGFGLTTNVEGALQVVSSSGSVIRGNGQLRLVDGRYSAYGQELTIEQGELVFNGPLDQPDLNIRATRSVDSVTTGVQLTGTPGQLNSTLFSDPAMSDAEALSYLLTGRPLSRATTGEGNTLNEAAFALGLSQAGAVTSQIQNTLGLDSLTIEGGADSGRIVAGRRVGGRLFVEYGYGLVDQLGTLLLRLQLTDNIVVESSSGSTTTLNVVYSITKE